MTSTKSPISPNTAATPTTQPPIDLSSWVEENRHLLKPPVGNKYLYNGNDFLVMIVGGPNARNDFHITASEEFFYQIKGDVVVRTRENGRIKDNIIREGETFFIPPNVPHSPQRPPNTIGLVIERQRPGDETEHMAFYCEKCGELVHDIEFKMRDIVDHFKQVMEDFWKNDAQRACRKCGARVEKPGPREHI